MGTDELSESPQVLACADGLLCCAMTDGTASATCQHNTRPMVLGTPCAPHPSPPWRLSPHKAQQQRRHSLASWTCPACCRTRVSSCLSRTELCLLSCLWPAPAAGRVLIWHLGQRPSKRNTRQRRWSGGVGGAGRAAAPKGQDLWCAAVEAPVQPSNSFFPPRCWPVKVSAAAAVAAAA